MQTYDDIAEWYDEWIGTHDMREDPYFPAAEALIGEVGGQRICDLACGQGRVARHLARMGATVVGIDLSAKLLEIARRNEESDPRGITYVHADVRSLDDDELLGKFDGVMCYMALMDIADLAPAFASVSAYSAARWMVCLFHSSPLLSHVAVGRDGDSRGACTYHSPVFRGGLLAIGDSTRPSRPNWRLSPHTLDLYQ